MSQTISRPHRLGINCVPVYYAGGKKIAQFRSGDEPARGPEDWVGSTAALPAALLASADPTAGISHLEDGTLLRDAVRDDPTGWLGPDLGRALSDGEIGVLVKLLDAGERLPVHCHPSRESAKRLLGSRFGKTEGWAVMDADKGSSVWLGFSRDLDHAQLARMIAAQDVDSMLASMNRVEVRTGDILYVPAGTPHAIGSGVFLTELQEPTSFSILAEYASFGLDEGQATLGLGWETAITCFNFEAFAGDEAGSIVRRPERLITAKGGAIDRLFPVEADDYFRAFRLAVEPDISFDVLGYRVLIVTAGEAELEFGTGGPNVVVREGDTWALPFGTGELRAVGRAELVIAMPPAHISPE
ncbi:MAG TPA: class I mannose-6-phosphate isomerase [Acidimicrobiales bacterium]|nr:class I mannose-6-phosphate isomerase [Acidimicrobiales bacterium]